MKHIDTGTLRRALDEPGALLGSGRRHLDGCVACRRRSTALAAQADAAAAALGRTPEGIRVPFSAVPVPVRVARLPVALWSACAAAALIVLFAATPLRTFARDFLAIFEPRQFVALPISSADSREIKALPDLGKYGMMRDVVPQHRALAFDAAHAALLARMPVSVPAFVPLGSGTPEYRVISRGTTTFTFSRAKAEAAAAVAGRALPAMPPGMDGSTLAVTVGPVVMAVYGTAAERNFERRHRARDDGDGWPKLLVAQMPAPTLSSNGVSAATLLAYLAAQPGLPPAVAAELRAIGDPTSTLPIPIPIDRMRAAAVSVQGSRALVVGDNTGVGAGVIWQSRGYVYGVAGTLPVRAIIAIANSLRS